MRARVWQTVLCSGFFFSCDKISKNVLIFGLHEIVLSKLLVHIFAILRIEIIYRYWLFSQLWPFVSSKNYASII
jgi:hypothetical protein